MSTPSKGWQARTIAQRGLLLVLLLGLGYWAWNRTRPPRVPTYEGKTLAQWLDDLGAPDYAVSDRAADALVRAGPDAVPSLLEARGAANLHLYRRAAAVLVRIGAPAAPGLVAALKDSSVSESVETILVRMGPDAVPALIDGLADENVCKGTAHVLIRMGPRGTGAVPALIEVLQRRNAVPGVREEVAEALGRIGEPAAAIVPALIAALKDDNAMVRQKAAESLGWIGAPARAATPALLVTLKDDKEKVAGAACWSLGRLGGANVPRSLLEVLQGDRDGPADVAGQALWQMGRDSKEVVPALVALLSKPPKETGRARTLLVLLGPIAVPDLAAALDKGEPAVQQAAAEVLGQIGPVAREAVSALAKNLQDKPLPVKMAAALALAQIDPTRQDAVPLLADSLDNQAAVDALAFLGPNAHDAATALIAALKHRDKAIRDAVRHALARIGPRAVPKLIDALKNGNGDVAILAAEALGAILPPPTEAVAALRQALKRDRAHAAVYARALSWIGPPAHDVVPDLIDLLGDAVSRADTAAALVRIDPAQSSKAMPVLLSEIKEKDRNRQLAAIHAAGRLGSVAKPLVSALAEQLDDPERTEPVLAALYEIGPEAEVAVPTLVARLRNPTRSLAGPIGELLVRIGPTSLPEIARLLPDSSVELRRFAALLLSQFGPSAKTALPALMHALKDSDTEVRWQAAHALEEIGPDARDAVPALIENLFDSHAEVRHGAALALGHIGPSAKEARAPLMECLMDPHYEVRYAAALAIGRIDPKYIEAVPALLEAMRDPFPKVCLGAIDSLARIDRPRIEEAVPVLVALSQSPYPTVTRFKALEGLLDFGRSEEARRAVPLLQTELSGMDPGLCLSAALLLERIKPDEAFHIVLVLTGALRDPNPRVRGTMIHALGLLGTRAREATPALVRLLQDDMPAVREQAAKALRLVNPGEAKRLGIG
jgi:HEAT repeat protein